MGRKMGKEKGERRKKKEERKEDRHEIPHHTAYTGKQRYRIPKNHDSAVTYSLSLQAI